MKKFIENKCQYIMPDEKQCGKKTKTHKYICDEHAEEVELSIYGRYCKFCGIDTFNELRHKKSCNNL